MVWDMTGFKITNIDFHQDVELPAGVYTYSCKLTPVYDYLIFRVGETDFTITNLQPGVYQKGVKLTFTVEEDETKFYPSRTVGDEIFDIMLEEGDKDTTPGPHILDISEEISRAGIQINDELIRLYAKKSEVSSQILQSAENINIRVDGVDDRLAEVDISINSITSRVSDAEGNIGSIDASAKAIDLRVDDLNDGLEATGINIQDKKIEITADTFIVKDNDGLPYLAYEIKGGRPVLKMDFIDVENLVANRLITPFVEVGISDFQEVVSGMLNVRIRDKGTNPVVYGWETVWLPSGSEYDGLRVNIESPYGAIRRIRIKPSDGGLIYTDQPVGSLSQIKLSYTTRARMQLIASWNSTEEVLDWYMTAFSSYKISTVSQTLGQKIPSILMPGDVIMTAVISSNGGISSIVSNWRSAIAASWTSGTGYMITLPWHFYYGTSSNGLPGSTPEIPINKFDVSVTLSSGVIKNVSSSIMNNQVYQRTQIYVGITDLGGSTLLQNEFCITVKAADYIVQDEYLEQNID